MQKVIRGTGTHRIDVIHYIAEHSTSPAWAVTTYDVDDASNYLIGFVRWFRRGDWWHAGQLVCQERRHEHRQPADRLDVGHGGGGSVATDTIWDAAGDLAVGSGADTAARLAKGNAGANLSIINSVVTWNTGTSFPGSKATNDRYYRTDLQSEYIWDGTRWISLAAQQMAFPFASVPPLTATGVAHRMGMPGALGGSDIYLGAVIGGFYVDAGTALSASHKWVGTVSKTNNAGATSLGTITIDSGASSQWRALPVLSIAAVAAVGSGYVAFEINWVKTGTPGNLYANPVLAYRTVAT